MKIVIRSVLFTFGLEAFLPQVSNAMFISEIFTYDDNINARGLHVSLKGTQWQAKEVIAENIPFYQQLFGNEEVMAGFADGQVRTPQAMEARLRDSWIPRFQNGQPHGGLMIFDPNTQMSFGHVVAGAGDTAGASEIAYAYMPTHWGKGIGSEVLGTIVQKWGPEVRRIGLGIGLDELQDKKIIQAFKCFEGKELARFDATASPSNPGSWKMLEKFGFGAAVYKLENTENFDFDNKEIQSPHALETELLKLFDSSSDVSYKIDTRYQLTDPQGKIRTFSKHATYDRIKYHFEYILQ